MAYQYDELGNVVGEYETEEEKRIRAAASQPVKQTITYNSDGTSEVTIKGTPEALSPINPNAPTLVNPNDDTYNRMLQVESGNRNYTSSGQPVTSPKGAMFASQVMPATAANPGYGIRPASSQTPEEYNRVGQEYYQAMLKKFGNPEAAAAAYNAGPGRVQQNIRQNQGQMNVGQLPQETQGYLQKIGNMVGNMIPSAQAGTLPTPMARGQNARDDLMMRPVNPAQMAPQPDSVINNQVAQYEARQPSQYSLGTGQGNEGIRVAGATPVTSPIDTRLLDYYQKQQDNPQALMTMGFADNENIPDWLKSRAKNRAAELITQQREMEGAKEKLSTMNESEIARALREKTTGGSYLKAMLFNTLGMTKSAAEEAAKLGIGTETMTQINGQPAMVKLSANGTPIEGYNAVTGKKLTAEELVTAAQFGTTMKGTEAEAGTYMDPTGKVAGNWVLERKPGGSQFRQVGTGKVATEEQANSLRKTGVQGTLGDQRARQIQEINLKLQGKGVEEQMRILGDYNKQLAGAGLPIIQPSEVGLNVPQIGTTPTTTAPAPTATGTPTTAAGTPAATTAGARPTAATLKGREEIVKKSSDIVADSAKLVTDISSIDRAATEALTKKNNFGTIISGMIPGEQYIGEKLKTQDHINTMNVLEQVNKQAAINTRMLGVNPTDRDLLFVTSTKPDITWSQEAVSDWLRKSVDASRRTLDFARKQLETGGAYIPETPQATNAGQFKILSVTPGPR